MPIPALPAVLWEDILGRSHGPSACLGVRGVDVQRVRHERAARRVQSGWRGCGVRRVVAYEEGARVLVRVPWDGRCLHAGILIQFPSDLWAVRLLRGPIGTPRSRYVFLPNDRFVILQKR